MISKHFLRNGPTIGSIRPYLLTATGFAYRSSLKLVQTYSYHISDQLQKLGLPLLNDADFCHIEMAGAEKSALVAALDAVKADALSCGVAAPDSVEKDALSPQDEEAMLSGGFVILIKPKRSIAVYQCFKDLTDRTYGFHSICTSEAPNYHSKRTTTNDRVYHSGQEKAISNYFANITMKANLKFGGLNHTTENVRLKMQETMVLGADLSHPGPGAIQGCPSISAIVGSVDDDGGKYLGSMRLQTLNQSDREVRTHPALAQFLNVNQVRYCILPKRGSQKDCWPGRPYTESFPPTSSTSGTASPKGSMPR
jgi:hypothetical protein